ncbi:MAG: serine protease [Gemmatimonadetes bacterium]|nr:serine protease [Gemmatimonadota bacterium]
MDRNPHNAGETALVGEAEAAGIDEFSYAAPRWQWMVGVEQMPNRPSERLIGGVQLMLGLLRVLGVSISLVCLGRSVQSQQPQKPRPSDIAQKAGKALSTVIALDSAGKSMGEGTGFFIRADGTLVTNYHVIEGAVQVEVRTGSGEAFDQVFVLSIDARRDLAILRIATKTPDYLQIRGDESMEVGDPVYVMGNPLGLERTFSNGLVSGRRLLDGVALLQITAPISPGSSGGPVMDEFGRVVGVATLYLDQAQNLNFAVAGRYVEPLLSLAGSPRPFNPALVAARRSTNSGERAKGAASAETVVASPAPARATFRSVADPRGLYRVASRMGPESTTVNGRLSVIRAQGNHVFIGWWQYVTPGKGGDFTLVNSLLQPSANGTFSLEVHKPLHGGFTAPDEVRLAPAGTVPDVESTYPQIALTRIALRPLDIGGIYQVEGVGGMTDVKADQQWRGEVAIVPSEGAIGQPNNEAMVAVSLDGSNGWTYTFWTTTTLKSDGSFACAKAERNDETWNCNGRVSGENLQIYVHRGIKRGFDYEAQVKGRRSH